MVSPALDVSGNNNKALTISTLTGFLRNALIYSSRANLTPNIPRGRSINTSTINA